MSHNLGFLSESAVDVAKRLIGYKLLVIEKDGTKTGGTIVETEAYNQNDAASHSYRGKTPRTEVMFGPAGRVYVYFTYGMHWCMNIVAGPTDRGEAVLIRAILPEQGLDLIRKRRGNKPYHQLTNGPAKVCQALGVTGRDNGQRLGGKKFVLEPPVKQFKTVATTRIGISKDTHRLWRFVGELQKA